MTDAPATKRRLDLRELGVARAYFFMISAIIPRPIAWVTSRGRDGSTNLAPFSFFQGVCAAPPTLMISISSAKRDGDTKDTLRNVRETGEFVVNMVSGELAEPMVASSAELGYGESEIDANALETFRAETVDVPALVASPVNMECRVSKEVPVGDCVAVFGEIELVHVREDVLDERGSVDPERVRAWGRLGGSLYEPFGEAVRIKRPS